MASRKAKPANKPHVEKRAAPSSVPPPKPPVPPAPAVGADAPETVSAAPVVQRGPRKFGRHKDVRDMDRTELEAYAMELGLLKRCLTLTDDRLRQNIQAFISEMFE